MTSFGRIFRKVFFAFLFFAFTGGTVFFLFGKIFTPKASCFDNIKNQDEKDVDCEGVCANICPLVIPPEVKKIEVDWVKAVASDANTYDLVAKIKNINKLWGLKKYEYQFVAKDNFGKTIFSQSGASYLLPDDFDYVILLSVKIESVPKNIEFNIFNEDWVNVSDEYNISSLSLLINSQQFNLRDESGIPSASGILINNTAYDFDRIDISVAVFGNENNLLGVNTSNQDTMFSKEERALRIVWDKLPDSAVYNVDFKAKTNIFNSKNFMRRYGVGGEVGPYR